MMHFQPHSQGRKLGKAYPSLFWKSKKGPWFLKKGPDCVHLWVNFSIQDVVLRVSRRKNSSHLAKWLSVRLGTKRVRVPSHSPKYFPVGSIFLVFLTKCLSKCPSSTKSPLFWKIFGCMHALRHYSFCPIVNVWQCSECLSVSVTAQ